MREIEQRAADAYRQTFGTEPQVVGSAPGRINLIGEHTDYNEGFVLPCAIDRRVAVAVAPGEGGFYSATFQELRPDRHVAEESWADYPRGVAWVLDKAGYAVPRFQAAFAGDVPVGAGLSSSAAIEAATALTLDTLLALGLSRKELAILCRRAENEFVGVNSGIMDQYASLLCHAGSALFIDCRSLEAESVPLDLDRAGLTLVVCDTRVKRGLGKTGYNERRAVAEQAAHTLGLTALRDATPHDLERLSGEELKRARHVVLEDRRVREAVEALRGEDFAAFGDLMYASHASLRDDYEVSIPELDTFVEVAGEVGALGARLTGAGFGGAAIALIAADRAGVLCEQAAQRFHDGGFAAPGFSTFAPADGAEISQAP